MVTIALAAVFHPWEQKLAAPSYWVYLRKYLSTTSLKQAAGASASVIGTFTRQYSLGRSARLRLNSTKACRAAAGYAGL